MLTIDVEDWFQVENFKPWIPFSTWPDRQPRAADNVRRLLDLFDEQASSQGGVRLRGTFFVLGWLAERMPELVREIDRRGHEVASHGFGHELCRNMSRETLGRDLVHSKRILEDIIGKRVWGYRAPSFSIDDQILDQIASAGYCYDSSYNSFALHGRYGKADLSQYPKSGVAVQYSKHFYELPVSNLSIFNRILPWGGGAYFRLMPFWVFRQGIRRITRSNGDYIIYIHPWEIDPDQPRVRQASLSRKLRHYSFLGRTEIKLKKMMRFFSEYSWISCRDYLMRKGVTIDH